MNVPLEILASYVPRLVLKRLESHPEPLQEPREEHRPGALLFADIAGFSRLADQLAKNNPAGSEELTNLLNDYFGHLIQEVHCFGGDVVKFAGDALLAFWPVNEAWTTLDAACVQAARCGLQIQSQLANYQAGEIALKLRINLVAGEFRILELGGVAGRWEFLLTGQPLTEMQTSGPVDPVGKVIASPVAWEALKSEVQAVPFAKGSVELREAGTATNIALPQQPTLIPQMEAGLRASLPAVVFGRLAAGQADWMGELRQLTVMFINLPWLESTIPLSTAQSIVTTVERSLMYYRGTLNKLSMDEKGVTAVVAFGLPPLTHEDDPVRAVLAARVLQAALTSPAHAPQIGITTGYCFCGTVGSDERREYTIIGDTANMAARLMQNSKGRVLCDAATKSLAQHRFEFLAHDPIKVKGRGDVPVAIFEPIKQTAESSDTQTITFGHEQQQERIAQLLEEHSHLQTRNVLLIEGEAGIGKSRLTQHLINLAKSAGYTIFTGSGDSIEETSPYHVWRPVMQQLLGQIPSIEDNSLTPAQRLLAWLESDEKLLRLTPLLNSLLPLEIPGNPTTRDMEGQVRADNLHRLIVGLLKKCTAQGPLLLVLDDGQWFDSASWAVTRQVAGRVPGLFLAFVTRPLEEPVPAEYAALKEMKFTKEIELPPLSVEETQRLICERLGVCDVPGEIVQWIYKRTEGNPLFSEELTFVLRDSEKVSIQNNRAELTCPASELETMECPHALQGVIRSRIDRLPPSELLAIKTASVIGRQFEFRVLHNTYPIRTDRDQLPTHMDSVCQRDLVIPFRETPELIYAFKHILIQDVAYNLMLFQQRRALHQAIAEWYESSDGSPNTTLALLAYHWTQAGDQNKAFKYQEQAGDHALRNGAYFEAAEYFRALLKKMKPATPQGLSPTECLLRASLERKLAAAELGLGHLAASRDHCYLALTWLGEPAPTKQLSRLPRIGMQLLRQVWHRLRAGKVVRPNPPPSLLEGAQILEMLAEIHYLGSETSGFLYACLRMLNLTEQVGPSPELARAFSNMGLTAATIPCRKLAESYIRQARITVEQVDHLPSLAWVKFTAGIYHVGLANWEQARATLNQALDLYRQLGDDRNFGTASTVLGGSYAFAGNFREGLRIWSEHHERSARRDDVLQQAWGHGGCALNLLRLGETSESVQRAKAALLQFETNKDRISEIMVHGVFSVGLLRSGELSAACEAADTVHEKLRTLGRPASYLLLEGYAAVVEVLLAKQVAVEPSQRKAIASRLRSALAGFKTYANIFRMGQPRFAYWQGEAARINGSLDKAILHWKRGLAVAEECGMRYEEGVIHWALAQYNPDTHQRQIHLDQAIELFEEMEVQYECQVVEASHEQLRAVPMA